jgi:hypothetical protein
MIVEVSHGQIGFKYIPARHKSVDVAQRKHCMGELHNSVPVLKGLQCLSPERIQGVSLLALSLLASAKAEASQTFGTRLVGERYYTKISMTRNCNIRRTVYNTCLSS